MVPERSAYFEADQGLKWLQMIKSTHAHVDVHLLPQTNILYLVVVYTPAGTCKDVTFELFIWLLRHSTKGHRLSDLLSLRVVLNIIFFSFSAGLLFSRSSF